MQEHHITNSMSRKGNPCDNATCEPFMKTLMSDYRQEYRDLAEVPTSIGCFSKRVYNERRLHSAWGNRPLVEFERMLAIPATRVYGRAFRT